MQNTMIELRKYVDTSTIDAIWPSTDPKPIALKAGGKLVQAIRDLPVTSDKTVAQLYQDVSTENMLKQYIAAYVKEKKSLGNVENDIQNMSKNLQENIQHMDDEAGKILAKMDTEFMENAESALANSNETYELLKRARKSTEIARNQSTISNALIYGLKKTWTYIQPPVFSKWPSRGGKWGKKSPMHWSMAMNELLASSGGYFKSDSLSRNSAFIDKLLPVYSTVVLSTKEKLSALEAVYNLTIMMVVRAENPQYGDPKPKQGKSKHNRLRQTCTMLRVLYVALQEYSKLTFSLALEIDPLLNQVAAHSLTHAYAHALEWITASGINKAKHTNAFNQNWSRAVYDEVYWMETAPELKKKDMDRFEYAQLITATLLTRDLEYDADISQAIVPASTFGKDYPLRRDPLPPLLDVYDAYLIFPRNASIAQLNVANNLRDDFTGLNALLNAIHVSKAITDGDFLAENVDNYSKFVATVNFLADTLVKQGQDKKDSKQIRNLKELVRRTEVDESTLEELHPKKQNASEIELVQYVGQLRMKQIASAQNTFASTYGDYETAKAKFDVASINFVDAFVSVQQVRKVFESIKGASDLKQSLSDQELLFRNALDVIKENLTQSIAEQINDLLDQQIKVYNKPEKRQTRSSTRVKIVPNTPAVEIEEDWLTAFGKVANLATRQAVKDLNKQMWNNAGFGSIAPNDFRKDEDALDALGTLHQYAEQRLAAPDARKYLTEDPQKVASMMDSLARAMRAFVEIQNRKVFDADGSVGKIIFDFLNSALGIEYQAAWEYVNQRKYNGNTEHLYKEVRRKQLLVLDQNPWYNVGTFNLRYLDNFRTVAKEAYPQS